MVFDGEPPVGMLPPEVHFWKVVCDLDIWNDDFENAIIMVVVWRSGIAFMVSGSIPGAGHLFRYVRPNQPPRPTQLSSLNPSGVGRLNEDQLRLGRQRQQVHSFSVWTRDVQIKLRFLENACHTWAPVCSRRGGKIYVYLILPHINLAINNCYVLVFH